MLRSNFFRTTLALAAAACLSGPAAAGVDTLEAADRLYEDCHWSEAFAVYARLADAGNTQAARIAYEMSQYGSALFGRSFTASPGQLERWRMASTETMQTQR